MGIVHGVVQSILFQPPEPTYTDHERLIWLDTSRGQRIAGFYVPHPRAEWTIIFSHANSEDIGYVNEWAHELSYHLRANVFIYDYTGYGLSSGSSTEDDCYADIEAVFEFVTTRLGIPPNRIIAYGRSVGSGPSVELGRRKPVRAVIVQSAFASIYRVALGVSSASLSDDLFCNVDKVGELKCPLFVIHGTKDQLVSLEHGEALYNSASDGVEPLWIQEGAHNNLEIYWKTTLMRRIAHFLESLRRKDVAKERKRVGKAEVAQSVVHGGVIAQAAAAPPEAASQEASGAQIAQPSIGGAARASFFHQKRPENEEDDDNKGAMEPEWSRALDARNGISAKGEEDRLHDDGASNASFSGQARPRSPAHSDNDRDHDRSVPSDLLAQAISQEEAEMTSARMERFLSQRVSVSIEPPPSHLPPLPELLGNLAQLSPVSVSSEAKDPSPLQRNLDQIPRSVSTPSSVVIPPELICAVAEPEARPEPTGTREASDMSSEQSGSSGCGNGMAILDPNPKSGSPGARHTVRGFERTEAALDT